MHVWVVEDEALIRLLLVDEIHDLGWHVREFSTADAAYAALDQESPFDVLITDVNMPGAMDGLELARQVRSERPGIKIIIMSGRVAPANPSGECDLYLSKPFGEISPHLRQLAA